MGRLSEGVRGCWVLVFVLAACATTAPRSQLAETVGATDMPWSEVRARVRGLAPRFMGELAHVADQIAEASSDPAIRQAMVLFQVNGPPQMYLALFQPDPLAALIDAWALTVQLQDVVEELAVGDAIAPASLRRAGQSFSDMEAELEQLWRDITGRADVRRAHDEVHAWAAAHPIRDSLMTRRSIAPLLAALTTEGGLTPLQATSELLESTRDLSTRFDVLSATLPNQARWQAEYLMRDLLSDPTVLASAGLDPAQMLRSLDRVATMAQQLPDVLARERQHVLAALTRERQAMQAFITAEREAVMAALRAERQAVMAQMNDLGTQSIDHAFDRMSGLADRLFVRALLVAALLGLIGLLALLLILRTLRTPPVAIRSTPRKHGDAVKA